MITDGGVFENQVIEINKPVFSANGGCGGGVRSINVKKNNMKEYKLPINKKILLILAFIGFFFVMVSTYFKITNENFSENYSDLFLGIALLFQIIPWIIVLVDLIKNRIHNKLLWFIGMFAFGFLTTILYLLNREKHMRLYKRFENV